MAIVEDLKLIDKEKLRKLMELLDIQSLGELQKRVKEIPTFNKEKFLDKMHLSDEQLRSIDLNDEELYHYKETWIDSINEAIKEQPIKKNSVEVITPNGSFVMRVCGEDQEKTIEAIRDTYREVRGYLPEPKVYENLDDFLKSSNLSDKIKKEFSKKDFPLIVYTLKFESEQQHQDFLKKIDPLLNEGKLKYLGKTPTVSPQPSSTPVMQEPVTQQGGPSSTPSCCRI